MPLDAKAMLADERARRRAEVRHPAPTRALLPDAVFKERCCDHGDSSPEDPVLSWGRKARGDAAKTASKIQADISRITADPTRNAAALALAAADLAKDQEQRQLKDLDAVIERVEQRIAEMRGEIESLMAPSDLATKELLPELRSVLRGLTDAQRTDLMFDAGDDQLAVMHAVASAPAFLSGAHHGQRLQMRNKILEQRRPVLLEMPAKYAAELALLKRARGGFIVSVHEVADYESAEAIRSLTNGAQ